MFFNNIPEINHQKARFLGDFSWNGRGTGWGRLRDSVANNRLRGRRRLHVRKKCIYCELKNTSFASMTQTVCGNLSLNGGDSASSYRHWRNGAPHSRKKGEEDGRRS